MSARVTDLEVTPAMLAEQKGWSRQKAWRVLRAIEEQRPGTLHRRGRVVYALASEIAPFIRNREPTPLERTVNQIQERFAELAKRFDASLGDIFERLRNLERGRK